MVHFLCHKIKMNVNESMSDLNSVFPLKCFDNLFTIKRIHKLPSGYIRIISASVTPQLIPRFEIRQALSSVFLQKNGEDPKEKL